MTKIRIIGGGLAGSEAAYQLLKRGHEVELYEMRPTKNSPAHKTEHFAELVCSNSLKSEAIDNASGLLKAELKMLDSLILKAAENTRVPAGAALSVNRNDFSLFIENELKKFDKLTVIRKEYIEIDQSIDTIIATGPLTSDKLLKNILTLTGVGQLSFYDAAAPIVSSDSIDYNKAFFASRYDKGDADYLNCPFTKNEYLNFYNELIKAESVKLHDFELNVFEGCMPVEIMAKRGEDTLRFGPMRPVGITDKRGTRYYAVVQLRKENSSGTMFNIVGFQTNLTFGEQKRIFRMIPGLENAEFLRYGVMHKNSFVNAPEVLDEFYCVKSMPMIYIAGQLSGVEGYVESTMSGLLAAVNLSRKKCGLEQILAPETSMCGSLSRFIANGNGAKYEPMNANYGVLPPLKKNIRDKKQKNIERYYRAIKDFESYAERVNKGE